MAEEESLSDYDSDALDAATDYKGRHKGYDVDIIPVAGAPGLRAYAKCVVCNDQPLRNSTFKEVISHRA